MLDPIEEAYARLTMLEFALEVVMANQLAQVSPDSSAQAKLDFVESMKRSYGVLTADADEARKLADLADRSVEMGQRFIEKVSRREAEIRGKLK